MLRLLLVSTLALAGWWQTYAFTLQIRVRHADGNAAAVTAQVVQHGDVVGSCVTDAAGFCTLAFTLDESGDDPVLEVVEQPFGPWYGPHGTGRQYILTDKLGTDDLLGFVLDAPAADGVVEDLNPLGEVPVPFWPQQSAADQAAGQATLQAATQQLPVASATTEATVAPTLVKATTTVTAAASATTAPRTTATVTVAPAMATPTPPVVESVSFVPLICLGIVAFICGGLVWWWRDWRKARQQVAAASAAEPQPAPVEAEEALEE
jgi:hypothetical protein